MDNVTFFTSELDGSEWAQIKNADGGFTSMPKAIYDEQQAALKDAANG